MKRRVGNLGIMSAALRTVPYTNGCTAMYGYYRFNILS
jgi:hypothetical protein